MANSNDGEGTGRKSASNAGKLLRDPKTPKKVKDVAARDLAQAPPNQALAERLLGQPDLPELPDPPAPALLSVRTQPPRRGGMARRPGLCRLL
jgi:hypothetical protein